MITVCIGDNWYIKCDDDCWRRFIPTSATIPRESKVYTRDELAEMLLKSIEKDIQEGKYTLSELLEYIEKESTQGN